MLADTIRNIQNVGNAVVYLLKETLKRDYVMNVRKIGRTSGILLLKL
mgnify:CR=1 FL=1